MRRTSRAKRPQKPTNGITSKPQQLETQEPPDGTSRSMNGACVYLDSAPSVLRLDSRGSQPNSQVKEKDGYKPWYKTKGWCR
ncbi:hypothetical protein T265_09139 [Opisthorchis viverrini]|uniref:Uncharacterized protein n=1 Tax=Opisthorchis viverrini TaxID=6198 RepID=A0A074Z6Z8_OPIVI|nr:hypothetical protein T265_09139 [Opisthorchis viverrini]KER22868.1 hypothetical protein T265_09139 [Opisthorchis viverrini]